MRSAPNNSFNPTPHRGAGRVLCATLARVRRPAKGRLNSGVRPQMNQPGSAQRSLGLLQTFFVGLASFAGASSSANVRAGKREVTAMMLATLFSFYAVCIEIFLHDHYGASILGWIRDLWPWQSDNSRSFKSVGFAFVLAVWLPLCVFWWRLGRTCESHISPHQPSAIESSLFFAWMFASSFGAFYLSLGMHRSGLAVLLQAAGLILLTLWFYRGRGRTLSAP